MRNKLCTFSIEFETKLQFLQQLDVACSASPALALITTRCRVMGREYTKRNNGRLKYSVLEQERERERYELFINFLYIYKNVIN